MIFTKELAYLPIVRQASAKYNVPVPLILAHIRQESNFDPNAYREEPTINDASYGLMQLLVGTAKTLNPSASAQTLVDPAFNIDLGTKYIAQNIARYGNDLSSAIAAYNAGSAYKDEDGKYISKSGNDVQYYVDKVYGYYQEYAKWLNNGAKQIDISLINPLLVFGFLGASALAIFYLNSEVKYVHTR